MSQIGVVVDRLRTRFGADFTIETKTVTVDTSGTEIWGFSANRLMGFATVFGSASITAQFDKTDPTAEGIPLAAGGSSIEIDIENDGPLPMFQLTAFTDAGTSDVYVVEVIAINQRVGG